MSAIKIPPATSAFWSDNGATPASAEEIAQVSAFAGDSLPKDYIDFITAYGFVEWDIDIPDSFDYTLQSGGQTVTETAAISHLETPTSLDRIMKTARLDDPDRGLPRWPANMFPIGGTPGEDQILIELDSETGRIWYWPERGDAWGKGRNTTLGFVAESFTAFVEGLAIGDD